MRYGTGCGLLAALGSINQRKRIHYVLQAGWRADKAIQGMGRTHRSNQAQAPHYVLVSTNLKGHKRFISTIARRLSQLGALTRGERKAGESGLFTAADNLDMMQVLLDAGADIPLYRETLFPILPLWTRGFRDRGYPETTAKLQGVHSVRSECNHLLAPQLFRFTSSLPARETCLPRQLNHMLCECSTYPTCQQELTVQPRT